jgi:hypothetical protein
MLLQIFISHRSVQKGKLDKSYTVPGIPPEPTRMMISKLEIQPPIEYANTKASSKLLPISYIAYLLITQLAAKSYYQKLVRSSLRVVTLR